MIGPGWKWVLPLGPSCPLTGCTKNDSRPFLCQASKYTKDDSMKGTQCRMARAALEWSLDRLAEAAGVNKRTIMRHEAGETIQPEKVEALRAAFVREGVGFTNGGKRAGVTYPLKD